MSFHNGTLHTLVLGSLMMIAAVLLNCKPVERRQAWSRRWGPLLPHTTFPGDCGICHVPERWDVLVEDFTFDHEQQTGYPLEGAHATAACLRCHNDRGPVGVYVARGCGGCHPDPHAASLGMDCQRCHEQTSWRPTGLIAEHARTRFPLMGPEMLYETAGYAGNVVFPTAVVTDAPTGRMTIYYGAADTCSAVAFAHLDELLDYVKAHAAGSES